MGILQRADHHTTSRTILRRRAPAAPQELQKAPHRLAGTRLVDA
jgi:hypothetical protein